MIGADINAVAGENYSASNLLKSGEYNIESSTHNHKWGKTSPSTDDLYYPNKYPNTNFMIYTRGNFGTPFDKNTLPDTDPVYSLPPIQINFKK